MKRVKTCFSVVGALYCALCLCGAQDFNCTVDQNQDRVVYLISDESRPADYKASECSYVWINGTGHTIATKANRMPSLLESSINKLMASGCIENIVCRQHCKSETTGFGKDFVANCSISCIAKSPGNTDVLTWIVCGVVILMFLVGLVMLCRNKLLSTCSCRRYGPVRRQDIDQPEQV